MTEHGALEAALLDDMRRVGLPVNDFEFRVKDYSKSYYGVYRLKTNRVYIYMYKNIDKTMPYQYSELLCTAIHEAVHVIQHHDPNHKRVYGVMHDAEFKSLYSMYVDRAKALHLLQEVTDSGKNSRQLSAVSNSNTSCLCSGGNIPINSSVLPTSFARDF